MLEQVTRQLEKLMEGKTGNKFSLPRNRFLKLELDTDKKLPNNMKGMKYSILWGMQTPSEQTPYNQLDPYRLVDISFNLTLYIPSVGFDNLQNEGTIEKIQEKYGADIFDIRECLCYSENFGDVSDQIIAITQTKDATLSIENDIIEISIPFDTQQKIITGNEIDFNPSNIANLYAWFKASSTDVTITSDKISQWNDKSGNGRHATQSTAAYRPTFSATGGLKNKPYIATTESFALGTGLYSGNNSDWDFLHKGDSTVIVVAKTSGTGWCWLLSTHLYTVSDLGFSLSSTSAPGNVFSCNVGNGSGIVAGFALNSFVIDPSKYHKYIIQFQNKTNYEDAFSLKVDNKKLSVPAIRDISNSSSGKLGIGFGGDGYYSANSQIHEIIIFNRKLTGDELRQLEAYLQYEYGI
jgi:hypothetical protein